DLGSVGRDGSIEVEHDADADAYTAWAEGRLVFHRAPLHEVVAELARWYDIEVRVADSTTAARRVPASFDGEAPMDVLRFIALSLGLTYEHRGNTVTLASPE